MLAFCFANRWPIKMLIWHTWGTLTQVLYHSDQITNIEDLWSIYLRYDIRPGERLFLKQPYYITFVRATCRINNEYILGLCATGVNAAGCTWCRSVVGGIHALFRNQETLKKKTSSIELFKNYVLVRWYWATGFVSDVIKSHFSVGLVQWDKIVSVYSR